MPSSNCICSFPIATPHCFSCLTVSVNPRWQCKQWECFRNHCLHPIFFFCCAVWHARGGGGGTSQVAPVIKNLSANAGDMRDVGSIPGLSRSPGRGRGNPLQYSCLENPPGQRSLDQSMGSQGQTLFSNWITIASFNRIGDWDSERLNHLFRVTQLVNC